MKSRLLALLISASAPWPMVSSALADSPCFEEIEQQYAWDDGGLFWKSVLGGCPGSPQPAAPADRATGGNLTIRASGSDAMVIEEGYAWVPHTDDPGAGCLRYYKSITKVVRVAKDGRFHETRQVDGAPAKTTERALRPGELLSTSGIHMALRPDDAFVENLGADTIAGQPCQRVTPRSGTPGAGSSESCVYVAPKDCRLARYLQPLDLVTRGPGHEVAIHGRTTLLKVGARGKVFASDAIRVD
jgi:hypothetical protein